MQAEHATKLSKEISHLSDLIGEMEGKCQQPPSDLLQGLTHSVALYVGFCTQDSDSQRRTAMLWTDS
ncbi:hypothetical protein Y1Q_0022941 [Alligator mississippiensis]|uniref:Uncharacterized protein n=1 Tax=Alligator mississippiensis TaxID=8496 RepID=A0A151MYQ2_ALLMI|nr:hypothetical protein Y1Q_0022941 [Alligator mississippiensis]